ncbi:single-stranded-DNA-specific exonuclease RecJ [Helicobacter fennelliae]
MKLTKQKIKEILTLRTQNWDFKTLSSLPHPYTLKNCKEASQIITKSIQEHKKILIVGDYDVDGIIASVVMMKFFEYIGYSNVQYVIPNRFEDGYGLSVDIIRKHIGDTGDIIITVDNGITAFEAAQFCFERGIPLIITDHHIPKDTLPNATYIINPQQKDCNFAQKEICGAMVAWYFCAGIKIALESKVNLTQLLELIMLATIADMMPLTQINKCIVLYGLKKLQNTNFLALQKLKTQLKTKNPTAIDISFSITPLINAAGRMGEGRIASEFLLCNDEQKSNELFAMLLELNKERKDTAKSVLEEAMQSAYIYDYAVIAKNDAWHEGVLGIVAAQMAEKFERPAFVFSKTNAGLKGSARSFGDIDLMQMLLKAKDYLGEFGGHSKAAGIGIDEEKFLDFCQYLQNLDSTSTISRKDSACGLSDPLDSGIFGEIEGSDIDEELLALLQEFEPFGQANPKPTFQATLQVKSIENIKNLHQKFRFHTTHIQAISFFSSVEIDKNQWVKVDFNMHLDIFGNKPIMVIKQIQEC